MTGDEHYRKAEQLVAGTNPLRSNATAEDIAAAQVHATLAHAAAIAHANSGCAQHDTYGGVRTARDRQADG